MYNKFATVDEYELSSIESFVGGGGYLMYTAKWNKDTCKTYHDVFMQYVNCLKNNFMLGKTHVAVVFDGYEETNKKKRVNNYAVLEFYSQFQISASAPFYGNQERFFEYCLNQEALDHHAVCYTSNQ